MPTWWSPGATRLVVMRYGLTARARVNTDVHDADNISQDMPMQTWQSMRSARLTTVVVIELALNKAQNVFILQTYPQSGL